MPEPPAGPEPGPTPTAGTANFSKFIAIGNSFGAGVQGGALFTDGQNNSMPSIMAKQFETVGGGAFNQPSINATLGWNLFITQPFLTNPASPVLGRLRLQGTPPRPTPQAYAAGNLEAVPNPTANPGFIYAPGKTNLNNFSVPAIVLGQSLITQTGNWALAGVDPRFNPFYGRLAAPPGGSSTLIGDAALAGGSFFMFYLGLDDFFLHAAFGADPARAPLTQATGGLPNGFDGQYGAAITTLLNSNPNLKGVVGNFPDIFVMPHFTSVPWNAIVFTSSQAALVTSTNSAYATYNAGLDNAVSLGDLPAAERDRRRINFVVGANGQVIEDETLTTVPGLPKIRHATSADVFPLATGSILGTLQNPANPASVWGVGVALTDQYAIVPEEKQAINDARLAYNNVIQTIAAGNNRLALADVNAAFQTLVTNKAGVYNGVTITPNINPPTGMYSEDGVHLNARGYAFLANIFIGAINSKFGATVPLADLSKYSATGLPIP